MYTAGGPTLDTRIRTRAFEWLTEQVDLFGDVLPRTVLAKGFVFHDQRIPLVSPQGIFKPKQMDLPLSITTAPKSRYNDGYVKERGVIQYKYRGTDPGHRDNVGLRTAFHKGIPLVYFHGLLPGKYLAVWPVYIVGDDPQRLSFHILVDDISHLTLDSASLPFQISDQQTEARRQYITATVRRRLHQKTFRERVLQAYRMQCALCRLKHLSLLDAAHIIPDSDPEGEPLVNNGIALCKLHHAAFDSFMIGITTDFIVEVREDILDEEDGPMLQHGLKDLQSRRIILPASRNHWPDRMFLEKRYKKFRRTG